MREALCPAYCLVTRFYVNSRTNIRGMFILKNSRSLNFTLPLWHQKKAVKKICFSSLKNEIHVLPVGFIVSTEVILSSAIFCRCNYFILA